VSEINMNKTSFNVSEQWNSLTLLLIIIFPASLNRTVEIFQTTGNPKY